MTLTKKDMQRLLELGAKFIEVLAVKVSTATEPKKFIAKQVDIFIVFDLCKYPQVVGTTRS